MANHTSKIYNDFGDRLVIDAGGTLDASNGTVKLGSLDFTPKVTLFDDFLGDVLDDAWSGAKGSDGQAVVPTINPAIGGWVRLTSGDTVTPAESISSLTHGLNWKAESGGLAFEAKVKPVSSVASVAYFIGLTDALATGTLEEPVTLSGTSFTSNATDCVGFVFDTAATTDVFYCIGVKNNADTAATATIAPAADTAVTLRIELSAAGAATFYVNGNLVATIADAVTPSVALTPIVEVMTRTTAVKSIDADYIHVQSSRG